LARFAGVDGAGVDGALLAGVEGVIGAGLEDAAGVDGADKLRGADGVTGADARAGAGVGGTAMGCDDWLGRSGTAWRFLRSITSYLKSVMLYCCVFAALPSP